MSVDLLAIALLTTLFGAPVGAEDEVVLWRYAGTVRIHDAERQVSLAVLDGLSPEQDYVLKNGYRVESNGGFEISIDQRATIDVRGADTVTLTAIDSGSASFEFGSGRNVIFKLNGLILTAKFPGELVLATESQTESLIQVATIGENLLVKNIQGADVLIYRGQDPLHRLEAGNRLEIPVTPTRGGSNPRPPVLSGSPPDEKAPPVSVPAEADPIEAPMAAQDGETFQGPRSVVWGAQVVRLPQGVRASVRGIGNSSRLELERDPGATGVAVVKLGSARLLMGPGARVVINASGRVIGVQGQVIGGPGVVGLGGSSGGANGGFNAAGGFVAPNPYEQSDEYSPGHDG